MRFGKSSSHIGKIFIKIGKNIYFFALGTGPFMAPGYIGRKIPDLNEVIHVEIQN